MSWWPALGWEKGRKIAKCEGWVKAGSLVDEVLVFANDLDEPCVFEIVLDTTRFGWLNYCRPANYGASACMYVVGRAGRITFIHLRSSICVGVLFIFVFFFFWRQALDFFFGSWFYAFLFLWFSAFLLLCFSASVLFCLSAFIASLLFLLLCFLLSLLLCFSCFSAFLLFAFPASLLFCFSVLPASLLLYFCAFLLLLFYFFFSSVMCFCCSTSCSFASLLPVFSVSLFFISFALFCSVCILNETLERP